MRIRALAVLVASLLAGLIATGKAQNIGAMFDGGSPQTCGGEGDGSEFVFARLEYGGSFYGLGGRGSWAIDWPEADFHFMLGMDRLTNIRVVLDDCISVAPSDPELFDYPLVYAVEVGRWSLDPAEADRLREYVERGGFLVVDDFWGTVQWDYFYREMVKIFPDREVEDVPLDHPVFHAFYDIEEILQVPGIGYCRGNPTWQQDGYTPHALGVFGDDRRLMMMINFNTDLGDAWEHADDPCYPHMFSGFAYRMGINFVVYSMTH
jgi:Domain of unknown function (DUF4159)